MKGSEESAALEGIVSPPKELPSFFAKNKWATPIVPPTPPQLHPFPKPVISFAPPTPFHEELSQVDEAVSDEKLEKTEIISHSAPEQNEIAIEPSSAIHFTETVEKTEILTYSTPEPVANPTIKTAADDFNGEKKLENIIDKKPENIAIGLSEIETALDKLESDKDDTFGMIGWIQKTVKQSNFLSKVADKAKMGMDSVLTTLDPGMKDFLKTDNEMEVIIHSDNERIAMAIVDGFRRVFTRLIHRNIVHPNPLQIIGHEAVLKYTYDQLLMLSDNEAVNPKSPVIFVQSFLYQVHSSWYESSLIAAKKEGNLLHVLTQPVLIDNRVIEHIQSHKPAADRMENAFLKSVGTGYAEVFGADSDDWQFNILSYSSSELYSLAAAYLANLLKNLNEL